MDALITAAAASLIKTNIPPKRVLAGSALSALISTFFTIFPVTGIYPYICSAASLLPIIIISFRPSDFKRFLKHFFFLYLTSFLFGGFIFSIMLARESYVFPQRGIYGIKPILMCGAAFAGILFSTEKLLAPYFSHRNLCCEVKVHFMGKSVCGTGFIDTGNFLMDPLTGKPAIAADIHSVLGLFPNQMIKDILNSASPSDIGDIFSEYVPEQRFRLIPYSAFGEKPKYMSGFVSDFTEIISADKKNIIIRNLTIGITCENFNLSTGSGFILNPEIFK